MTNQPRPFRGVIESISRTPRKNGLVGVRAIDRRGVRYGDFTATRQGFQSNWFAVCDGGHERLLKPNEMRNADAGKPLTCAECARTRQGKDGE